MTLLAATYQGGGSPPIDLQTFKAKQTSLHLWGECAALELARFQLSSMGDGRNKTIHSTILDFFSMREQEASWKKTLNGWRCQTQCVVTSSTPKFSCATSHIA